MIKKMVNVLLIGFGLVILLMTGNSVSAEEIDENTNEDLNLEIMDSLDEETLEVWNKLDDYITIDKNGASVFDIDRALQSNESDLLIEIGEMMNEFGTEVESVNGDVYQTQAVKKLLVYGNFCGLGNNGKNKKPIDNLDSACKAHDGCYSHKKGANNKACNRAFIKKLLVIIQTTNNKSRKHLTAVGAAKYFSDDM